MTVNELVEFYALDAYVTGYAYKAGVICKACARRVVERLAPRLAPRLEYESPELYDSETLPQPEFFGSEYRCDMCGEVRD